MSRAAASSLFFIATACSVALVGADSFLQRLQELSPELERALLAEVEQVLGAESKYISDARLAQIEEAVRPTFESMPKNEHGRLGHAAVRYVLHRLFVQRHAWFVSGLDPAGESWNVSSPSEVLAGRVPELVQTLFEERIGSRGFAAHEIAVLAATLEHLVHNEAVSRLQAAYTKSAVSMEGTVPEGSAEQVIDLYMASFIFGSNLSSMNAKQVRWLKKNIGAAYPEWPATQKLVREVKRSVHPEDGPLSFADVTSVVEEVGERYGHWQDAECRTMKTELLTMEQQSTGRVRLADFYGSALNQGKWQYSEAVDYLRQLGALDESNPDDLAVIVTNYLASPSNCLASSSYYSVCCIDECEGLLGHLERSLGVPEASPAEIAARVALLPSATTPANRTLAPSLLQRLDDVATHHGGRVPLHGRLFAQWLHFAYPRECPYPHATGTIQPKRAEVWEKEAGRLASATEEEMRQHVNTAKSQVSPPACETDHCMWTMEEELVVPQILSPRNPKKSPVMFGVVIGSAALSLAWTLKSTLADAPENRLEKYLV